VSGGNRALALTYSAAGISVFPCDCIGENAKKPYPGIMWRELSTTDLKTINLWWDKWPDALPAIDCGKAGLVVIDPDRHEGGVDGVAHWNTLLEEHGWNEEQPVTDTSGGGKHFYFRQLSSGRPIKCGKGSLKGLGICVKGDGGYVIASGAVLPDGRMWRTAPGTPELLTITDKTSIPEVPEWLAKLVRAKPNPWEGVERASRVATTEREKTYAQKALKLEAEKLANTLEGKGTNGKTGKDEATGTLYGRNNQLNEAAHSMGTMVGAGWIELEEVQDALSAACEENGLGGSSPMDDFANEFDKTFASGMNAGIRKPRHSLQDEDARKYGVLIDAETGEVLDDTLADNGAKRTKLPFRTVKQFCSEYEPPSYIIDKLIRSGSLYSLTARTGHGKTAFLVVAALAIATGRADLLNHDVTKGRVVYLTFENPDDVRMRFMIAAAVLGVNMDEVGENLIILDERAKPEKIRADLAILADEAPICMAVVDTFAAFFDGR